MKKLVLIIVAIVITLTSFAQQANRGTNLVAPLDSVSTRDYFMVMDLNHPLFVFKQMPFTNAVIGYQAVQDWFRDSFNLFGDHRYYSLSNPAGYISSVSWGDVSDKPTLFDGDYNSLTNKPTIPAAQVNADWDAVSGIAQILNKPTLFSGDYDDLSNKPSIPTNTNQLTNGAGFITSSQAPVQSVNGQTGNVSVTDSIKVYNASGAVNQKIKVWAETLTPNTGNGYAVDISSAGFNTVLSVSAISEFSTGTTTTMRNVEVKSVSTTQVVVNIAQPNATNISLLGLTLLGVPTYIGSGTGTKLHIVVYGY